MNFQWVIKKQNILKKINRLKQDKLGYEAYVQALQELKSITKKMV